MWALLIILFIIGVIIIYPLLKVALSIRRQYREINRIMNGGAPKGSGRNRRKPEPPKPPVKKKKIDGSVGEYVEFEELRVETSVHETGDSTTVEYKVEQQITDVEFEDLP
ncbi:MAG: hypothetical protein K2O00_00625 [Muribaculaceae bacterium]|nr:hypothetical protein [Muribaculaceae bacterium]